MGLQVRLPADLPRGVGSIPTHLPFLVPTAGPHALVRMPSGKYVKVKVGDRLDGGQVAAISDNQLSYVKNGKTLVLKMIKAG